MSENQNSTSSNNTQSDSSPKKNIKKNRKANIYKYQLISCLKKNFNKIIQKLSNCHSKFSLTIQILFLSIPFSFIFYFIIFFANYYGYEKMFTFCFYNTLKYEYLNPLVKDIDEAHLDVGMAEIKTQLEELDNLFFFRIYFEELISMGLLDDDPKIKIFPNISLTSEKDYKILDSIQNEFKVNNIYTIPKNESEKYIDNRTDHLSEIGKIYYYMLPILTYEALLKKTYINETFLIAYEYDKNNKNILGEELYFGFPKLKSLFGRTNNFIPTNIYLSPQIVRNKPNFVEKVNKSFYTENWFIKQDYEFRESSNDLNNLTLSFYNLNYNYFGQLNKSNIVSLQYYININDKSYIINILYFINKKILIDGNYQHSIFLLSNNINKNENIKYSDNNTYLISKPNIMELSLSTKLNEYFHYGMRDINNSFYKDGVSFDNFDIEKLGEPSVYYTSTENLNIDLRYFSNLYFYALLFNNLELTEKKELYPDISQIEFNQNETIVKNICEVFNFPIYIKFLKEYDRNCWDHNTLLFYSNGSEKEKSVEEIVSGNYINRPQCICLPLFCLKNNKEDININNLEYIDKIILPSECQNKYKFYLNGIDETFKSHSPEYEPISKYNYGFNQLSIFVGDIRTVLEEEYNIFRKEYLHDSYGISFMIVTMVNNTDMKSLVSSFITFIYLIKSVYLLIILVGMFISFLLANILIYIRVKKISNVIFEYEKIHQKYLSKLEETSSAFKKQFGQNDDSFDTIGKKKSNNYENNKLINIDKEKIEKENFNNLFLSNDNVLIEELLELFYDYYSISKIDIINNKEKVLNHYFEEENELFQLLKNISIYISKFKLVVSFDYNFFKNSRLNQYYIKSLPKNIKLNNQQVILTQSVIFELLSTEQIEEFGLITNFYFKHITNINLNSVKNSIKNCLFKCLIPDDEDESFISNINNDNKDINNSQLIEDNLNNTTFIEDNNTSLHIIRMEENNLLDDFESSFENDDYLKKDKLKINFDSFLVNVYYKYLKKLASKKYE